MTVEVHSDLDELCGEDIVIKQLVRTMRDGRGMSLDGGPSRTN